MSVHSGTELGVFKKNSWLYYFTFMFVVRLTIESKT